MNDNIQKEIPKLDWQKGIDHQPDKQFPIMIKGSNNFLIIKTKI
ncbi:MAG: hypothetical protein QHH09_02670 [Microgenomates group bacterium]|nr:hypothetical protein [Microgenomates group bacterium]